MRLTISVIYNRRKILNKNGTGSLEVRLNSSGKVKHLTTSVKVKPTQWDETKKRIKNHPKAAFYNKTVTNIIDKAEDWWQMSQKTGLPNLNNLIDYMKGDSSTPSLNEFIEKSIKQNKKLKSGTISNHKKMLNFLNSFKSLISFEELGYKFIYDFEIFLLNQDDKIKSNRTISQNYTTAMLAILKRYTKLAIKLGYLNSDPFVNFDMKKTKTEKQYLTLIELKKVERLDLSSFRKMMHWQKDLFLFMCYTGIRFSDTLNLRVSDLSENDSGGLTLKITPIKTEKAGITVEQELNNLFWGRPEKIVRHFMQFKTSKEKIFPNIENTGFRRNIVNMMKKAGIDKHITPHSARHSFAMILLNEFSMRLNTVSKLMGHANIESTQIYAKMLNTTTHKEVSDSFNELEDF